MVPVSHRGLSNGKASCPSIARKPTKDDRVDEALVSRSHAVAANDRWGPDGTSSSLFIRPAQRSPPYVIRPIYTLASNCDCNSPLASSWPPPPSRPPLLFTFTLSASRPASGANPLLHPSPAPHSMSGVKKTIGPKASVHLPFRSCLYPPFC